MLATAFSGCIGGENKGNNEFIGVLQDRIHENIDSDWKFYKDIDGTKGHQSAESANFDDSNWRDVDLPHDWSIEGPFGSDYPAGSAGGALPGGIGWYRKHIEIPKDYSGKKVFIDFDGVYMNSTVWVNGNLVGNWPYGYTSFQYDITPYLKYGGNNVISVKADNSKQPNSRWYSGSGIYRHVWLTVVDKLHVAHWGTYVTTPTVSAETAKVNMKTNILNEYGAARNCVLLSQIMDANGSVVGMAESAQEIGAGKQYEFNQDIQISSPKLWDIENPYLYKIYTIVKDGDRLVDDYETTFGIRTISFDANKGFFLNGKPTKILGTCNHHDDSCLGAALPDRANERRVQLLKEMGSNAFRTSHNPPTPELLDYCDQYGMLVMNEAFDCWVTSKTTYDYAMYFNDWWERDLENLIKRDRNHPSVVIWSVGNEITDMTLPEGKDILKNLIDKVRELDPTRPVTVGTPAYFTPTSNLLETMSMLEVVGYNYGERTIPDLNLLPAQIQPVENRVALYDLDRLLYPDRKMIATETTSEMSSRGHYKKPYDAGGISLFNMGGMGDGQCSGYDDDWLQGWSHQGSWRAVKNRDFMSGLFIWTGFDYRGEPLPYGGSVGFESDLEPVSSYFGIFDLCGFPKDHYYLYKSQWTDEPTLHIFPHWNWENAGPEWTTVTVWAYTNCDTVELFVNDQSMGKRTFSSLPEGNLDLHIEWEVPYSPGTLKAVGSRNGRVLCIEEIKTAGAPAKIELTPDRCTISADGCDLSYITVRILDKDGNFMPIAENQITFSISGEGKIRGVCNGDALSHEDPTGNTIKASAGMCLLVLQSTTRAGEIKLTASSSGLISDTTTIISGWSNEK
ncbi:MAG: glycoside hydrolase family 2 [Thermoplasmata archaeon HGW-Thermoplasmata-1]|nr:MAG: glycoside hydrolase family 2 [Thermoplasmata archaeon HGW-Thermoplasmata-1]